MPNKPKSQLHFQKRNSMHLISSECTVSKFCRAASSTTTTGKHVHFCMKERKLVDETLRNSVMWESNAKMLKRVSVREGTLAPMHTTCLNSGCIPLVTVPNCATSHLRVGARCASLPTMSRSCDSHPSAPLTLMDVTSKLWKTVIPIKAKNFFWLTKILRPDPRMRMGKQCTFRIPASLRAASLHRFMIRCIQRLQLRRLLCLSAHPQHSLRQLAHLFHRKWRRIWRDPSQTYLLWEITHRVLRCFPWFPLSVTHSRASWMPFLCILLAFCRILCCLSRQGSLAKKHLGGILTAPRRGVSRMLPHWRTLGRTESAQKVILPNPTNVFCCSLSKMSYSMLNNRLLQFPPFSLLTRMGNAWRLLWINTCDSVTNVFSLKPVFLLVIHVWLLACTFSTELQNCVQLSLY